MAKVILICGKPCSGKTTYAKSLLKANSAVILSTDEIGFALFGAYGLYEHGCVVEKLVKYLYGKSLEIIEAGINVIIDWGFWTQSERQEITTFYKKHNVAFEWHYIDVPNEVLRENLNKRNNEIEKGLTQSYYFDINLINDFWERFEAPTKDEMDVWINSIIV